MPEVAVSSEDPLDCVFWLTAGWLSCPKLSTSSNIKELRGLGAVLALAICPEGSLSWLYWGVLELVLVCVDTVVLIMTHPSLLFCLGACFLAMLNGL